MQTHQAAQPEAVAKLEQAEAQEKATEQQRGTAVSPLVAVGGNPTNHANHLRQMTNGRFERASQHILQLQNQLGNRHVQQLINPTQQITIQPKLLLGDVNTPSEGQADQIASEVMRGGQVSTTPTAVSGATLPVSPKTESAINQAKGGGQPLPESTQAQMSHALGTDLSGVRIHTDGRAHNLNQSLQAKAFTTGQDIFFRQGAYNLSSSSGQQLLSHELTHVAQQGQGSNIIQRRIYKKVSNRTQDVSKNEVIQILNSYGNYISQSIIDALLEKYHGPNKPAIRLRDLIIEARQDTAHERESRAWLNVMASVDPPQQPNLHIGALDNLPFILSNQQPPVRHLPQYVPPPMQQPPAWQQLSQQEDELFNDEEKEEMKEDNSQEDIAANISSINEIQNRHPHLLQIKNMRASPIGKTKEKMVSSISSHVPKYENAPPPPPFPNEIIKLFGLKSYKVLQSILDHFTTEDGMKLVIDHANNEAGSRQKIMNKLKSIEQMNEVKISGGQRGKIQRFLRDKFSVYLPKFQEWQETWKNKQKAASFRKSFPANGTIIPNDQIPTYFQRSQQKANENMTARRLQSMNGMETMPSYWVVDDELKRAVNNHFLRPVFLIRDLINSSDGVVTNKTVYRGDGRGPYKGYGRKSDTWSDNKPGVLETGFKSWGRNEDLFFHALGLTNMDSAEKSSVYVSTTTSQVKALHFSRNPPHNRGWIYMMKVPFGFDVNAILGGFSPHHDEQEIAVPYEIDPDIVKVHSDDFASERKDNGEEKRKNQEKLFNPSIEMLDIERLIGQKTIKRKKNKIKHTMKKKKSVAELQDILMNAGLSKMLSKKSPAINGNPELKKEI